MGLIVLESQMIRPRCPAVPEGFNADRAVLILSPSCSRIAPFRVQSESFFL
jgi:hypothetical protein